MGENEMSMGRSAGAVLAMVIVVLCAFGFFAWVVGTAKDARDNDTQRRQEQKDSISVNVKSEYSYPDLIKYS